MNTLETDKTNVRTSISKNIFILSISFTISTIVCSAVFSMMFFLFMFTLPKLGSQLLEITIFLIACIASITCGAVAFVRLRKFLLRATRDV